MYQFHFFYQVFILEFIDLKYLSGDFRTNSYSKVQRGPTPSLIILGSFVWRARRVRHMHQVLLNFLQYLDCKKSQFIVYIIRDQGRLIRISPRVKNRFNTALIPGLIFYAYSIFFILSSMFKAWSNVIFLIFSS